MTIELTATDRPLLDLLRLLQARRYHFVAPTPATHERVVRRPDRRRARDLAGVFGWSLPFDADVTGLEIIGLLERGGALEADGVLMKSRVRVSSLHGRLFLHSAYPTEDENSVFFGPDSYRFADFIRAELGDCAPGARIVDIGAGAGVGAIVAAGCCPKARVTMTDVNPKALRLARINAAFAKVEALFVETDGLDGIEPGIDVALANPPYIIDPKGRAYRDGGDMHGAALSLEMAVAAAERLAPGGRLLLYTGSAIMGGRDAFREALEAAMTKHGCSLAYREIDPDVFGEELEKPQYADVDRIAVIGAVATKR